MNSMDYGITEEEWQQIRDILRGNSQVGKAILFGSRVKGTYKPFSDVDLTLIGDDLTRDDLLWLYDAFYESDLPYIFDLSLFRQIKNEELIDHINRRGVVVYKGE